MKKHPFIKLLVLALFALACHPNFGYSAEDSISPETRRALRFMKEKQSDKDAISRDKIWNSETGIDEGSPPKRSSRKSEISKSELNADPAAVRVSIEKAKFKQAPYENIQNLSNLQLKTPRELDAVGKKIYCQVNEHEAEVRTLNGLELLWINPQTKKPLYMITGFSDSKKGESTPNCTRVRFEDDSNEGYETIGRQTDGIPAKAKRDPQVIDLEPTIETPEKIPVFFDRVKVKRNKRQKNYVLEPKEYVVTVEEDLPDNIDDSAYKAVEKKTPWGVANSTPIAKGAAEADESPIGTLVSRPMATPEKK